jgi:hypothetical protein
LKTAARRHRFRCHADGNGEGDAAQGAVMNMRSLIAFERLQYDQKG